jgi:hypothetical protein
MGGMGAWGHRGMGHRDIRARKRALACSSDWAKSQAGPKESQLPRQRYVNASKGDAPRPVGASAMVWLGHASHSWP